MLSSRASRSASGSTADGIERAGERVANEIASACDALSADGGDITFVGHSNGGLVSRWALGALEERGVLERWRPNAFVSLSSPHLGVSRKGGVGANPLEHEVLQPVVLRVVNTGLYGRTGEQLALLDAATATAASRCSRAWRGRARRSCARWAASTGASSCAT